MFDFFFKTLLFTPPCSPTSSAITDDLSNPLPFDTFEIPEAENAETLWVVDEACGERVKVAGSKKASPAATANSSPGDLEYCTAKTHLSLSPQITCSQGSVYQSARGSPRECSVSFDDALRILNEDDDLPTDDEKDRAASRRAEPAAETPWNGVPPYVPSDDFHIAETDMGGYLEHGVTKKAWDGKISRNSVEIDYSGVRWPFAALLDKLRPIKLAVPVPLPEVYVRSANEIDISKLHSPLQGPSRYPRKEPIVRNKPPGEANNLSAQHEKPPLKARRSKHKRHRKRRDGRMLKLMKNRLSAAGDEFSRWHMSSGDATQDVAGWMETDDLPDQMEAAESRSHLNLYEKSTNENGGTAESGATALTPTFEGNMENMCVIVSCCSTSRESGGTELTVPEKQLFETRNPGELSVQEVGDFGLVLHGGVAGTSVDTKVLAEIVLETSTAGLAGAGAEIGLKVDQKISAVDIARLFLFFYQRK